MNPRGVRTWGDPCRECGFAWALSTDEGVATMAGVPARFRDAVADNLRIFAERLAAGLEVVAMAPGPR